MSTRLWCLVGVHCPKGVKNGFRFVEKRCEHCDKLLALFDSSACTTYRDYTQWADDFGWREVA